jgi:hypothetical protein
MALCSNVLKLLVGNWIRPAIPLRILVCVSLHKSQNLFQIDVFVFVGLFEHPISQDCIGMGSNHTASMSIGKGPLGHVTTFFVDEQYAFGNVTESFFILEQKPRKLAPMHIPQRHVGVNSFHVAGLCHYCTVQTK